MDPQISGEISAFNNFADLPQPVETEEQRDQIVLQSIENSIVSYNDDDLEISLSQLVIPRTLPEANFAELYAGILELARSVNNLPAGKLITEKFRQENPDEDSMFFPLLIKIFLWPQVTAQQVQFLSKIYQELRPLFIVLKLIPFRDYRLLSKMLTKLDLAFPEKLPAGEYERILHEAKEKENSVIIEWAEKLVVGAEVAPKPEYVRKFFASDEIPEPPKLQIILPEPMEAAKIMLETEGDGLQITQNQAMLEILARDYANSSDERKMELIGNSIRANYMSTLSEDPTLFRLLGPCHPLADFQSLNYNHPCLKYGGCRMLVCNHRVAEDYEEELDFNMPVPDFFTGVCDFCLRKIQKREYCVRTPDERGAWSGCFCGPDCARKSWDSRDNTMIRSNILDEVIEDLTTIGIHQRSDNNPILPWPQPITRIHPVEAVEIDISQI